MLWRAGSVSHYQNRTVATIASNRIIYPSILRTVFETEAETLILPLAFDLTEKAETRILPLVIENCPDY